MNNNIVNLLYNELKNNDIDTTEEINKIKFKGMSDLDLKHYLSHIPIYTSNDISKYNDITQILPNHKDYIFILYESSPNYGHWCLLLRNDNIIEYFDPYGYKIDAPIYWIPKEERNNLNLKPYLTDLLNKSNFEIQYNGYDFQNRNNSKISTCGRHCMLRLLMFLKYNVNLNNYITIMKQLKKKTKLSYDDIVSDLINKI